MPTTIDKLKRSHDIMVRIVAERDDGKRYVPIVIRLANEIRSRDNSEDEYQRILALAHPEYPLIVKIRSGPELSRIIIATDFAPPGPARNVKPCTTASLMFDRLAPVSRALRATP